MTSELSSRRKLRWAQLHRDELERKLSAWRKDAGHALTFQDNADGTERIYYFTCPPLPSDLPLVIGDVLHNVQSALDAWAWSMVTAHGDMPATEGGQNRVQFPIYADPVRFDAAIGGRLPGVEGEALDIIRDLQPQADDPEHSALWWLYQLSRIDKHRALHVVGLAGGELGPGGEQTIIRAVPPGFGIEVGIHYGDVEPGAMIAFARGANLPKVQVQIGYGSRVIIADSSLSKRTFALTAIGAIVEEVREALDRLEPLLS